MLPRCANDLQFRMLENGLPFRQALPIYGVIVLAVGGKQGGGCRAGGLHIIQAG